VADFPFSLPVPLVERLSGVADPEGKIVRALDALGPLTGRDVVVLDLPGGPLLDRFRAAGIRPEIRPLPTPLRIDIPDGTMDAVVSLWSGFRGVDESELAEADRVLRPDGRLLVVHDYGRDDVSSLRAADAPEYGSWSRRDGPFLRGGFKLRVVHCFWTFASLDDARSSLEAAFSERGADLAGRLKRPRLTWNVAIYHRSRGGARGDADGSSADAA
jgi:SAM-dependent methyltransferase